MIEDTIETHSKTAIVLLIKERYFVRFTEYRIVTAWSLPGAKLFAIWNENEIVKVETEIKENGKSSKRIFVKLQEDLKPLPVITPTEFNILSAEMILLKSILESVKLKLIERRKTMPEATERALLLRTIEAIWDLQDHYNYLNS